MRRSILEAGSDDEAEEINLTPMLDVVFIMLIFFIVTASFIKEAGIDVDRPAAETATPKPNANIIIAIGANNEIWIDRRKVPAQGVRTAIERLLAENPEGRIVIQADQESFAEPLMAVMEAAQAAGIPVSSISAEVD
jgi:biopolymer transport protein ExbD